MKSEINVRILSEVLKHNNEELELLWNVIKLRFKNFEPGYLLKKECNI